MCNYLYLRTLFCVTFAKATMVSDRTLLSDCISYIPKLATNIKTIFFQLRRRYIEKAVYVFQTILYNNFYKFIKSDA